MEWSDTLKRVSEVVTNDEDDMEFGSTEEEARYYRGKCRDLEDELEDTRLLLDELQTSSKELEEELEKDLAATEKREKELRGQSERLATEVENWKVKLQNALKEHAATLSHMHTELEATRQSEQQYRTRLRDMELDNDAMENSERALESTLAHLEARYGKAIERTALLEQELVDKARLEEQLQRLKDELRDTAEELAVLKTRPASAVQQDIPSPDNDSLNGDTELATPRKPPSAIPRPKSGLFASPLKRDSSSSSILKRDPSRIRRENSSSSSINTLQRSVNVRNLADLASTPKAVKEALTGMQEAQARIQNMKKRLDSRRESLVTTAIPRPRLSALPRSASRTSGIPRTLEEELASPTSRRPKTPTGGVRRPASRLGAATPLAGGRESTRIPSGKRMSLSGSQAGWR